MCKSFFTILLSSLCIATAVHAQSPETADQEADVRAVVDRLFDAMRDGDSTAVRSVIHPQARFMTTLVREGKPILHTGPVDGFVEAVGTPHDQVWDERIRNVDIKVDDRLATAWMEYAFYLDETFSHCGVNAMQFFHGEDGWKIIHLVDTRRQETCERF